MNILIQKGLGDAVYCYPIIEELAKRGSITVETKWREIFEPLKNVKCVDHIDRTKLDLNLRWSIKPKPAYKQLCQKAGVNPEFRLWQPKKLSSNIKHWSGTRKLCVVKEPYIAGYQKQKKDPSKAARLHDFKKWIDENRSDYVFVSVGKSEHYLYRSEFIEIDLNDKLSIEALLFVVSCADLVVTQIGHLIPIASAYGVPVHILPSAGDSEGLAAARKHCVLIPGVTKEL